MKEAGLSDTQSLEVHCDETLEDAYQAAHNLLKQINHPTALLVINDMLAIAVTALRATSD